MAADEIHVADVGTVITVTFKDDTTVVDISGATTKEIWLRDPANTTVKTGGTFTSDGTDGKLFITSEAATFGSEGLWDIQGQVILPGGTWHSDVTVFRVHPNL